MGVTDTHTMDSIKDNRHIENSNKKKLVLHMFRVREASKVEIRGKHELFSSLEL